MTPKDFYFNKLKKIPRFKFPPKLIKTLRRQGKIAKKKMALT